jgi:hypothetical protein
MKRRVPLKARLALATAAVVAAVVATPSAAPQEPVLLITLEPRMATNPVGTAHTVRATTTDALGNPVSVLAHIDVRGSGTGSTDCLTPCSFTYIGPVEPGADLIVGFIDFDADAQQDPGEPSDAVSKAWFDPLAPETGAATGGGHALDPLLGEFGFGFRASTTGPVGHCRIVNRNNGDQISCLTVDFVSVVGTHVTFSGMADVNGSMVSYTIDADDLDPGTDLFRFDSLLRDYQGPVTHGNIKVRPTG